MPGIHVRSLGKLDWVERGNEPVLTIPGAYWLCHKKHIYKFTFKWHKSLRNTEGFEYPKELTKVIRRIIKSQPRQGQQFGTRHLLVTYNHSAWMRQDKMFAMLKFREKTDATAFPHAFVLTVQTVNGSSTDDLREADQSKDRTKADSDTAKNVRVQGIIEANQETTEDKRSNHQTDIRTSRDLEKKDKIDNFHKITSSKKSAPETTSFISQESETVRKKDPGKRGATRPKSLGNIEDEPQIKRRNRRGYPSPEKNKKRVPPDSPAEKGIAADFADLPYQYIIERDIEGSKGEDAKINPTSTEHESSPGPSHKESDLPEKSLPRSPRSAQAETARSADITDLVMEGLMFTIRQDQDSITVVEQKTKLEMDEVLENSEKAETKEGEKCLLNSSLLRLENLITKIEMSEARLKTKENLQKSLEPIATERIFKKSFIHDFPVNANITPGSSEYSSCGTKYDAENDRVKSLRKSKVHSPISSVPKFPLVPIYLNNAKETLSDSVQLNDEEKTKETIDQDIAIGPEIADIEKKEEMDNWKMEEEEEDEVRLELKYDEKDDLEIDKIEEKNDDQEKDISESLKNKSCQDLQTSKDLETKDQPEPNESTTPCKNNSKMAIPRTPRIVSNEIVTDDQIPLELQKVLRQKLLKRYHLCNENEIASEDGATSPTEEDSAFDENSPESKSIVSPSVQTILSTDEAIEKPSDEQSSHIMDITEEFERELASEKIRKQPTRRKSLRHAEQTANQAFPDEPEIRLEMWKFMQDMTRGVKVVVHRLDLANIPNCIALGSSSLSKYNASQRYPTES